MFSALRRLYHRNRLARVLLSAPVAWRRQRQHKRLLPVHRVIDQLRCSIVGDVVLDLPEFEGHFACSPRSHLFARIAASGSYEPELAALVRRNLAPGRDMVDVGANIGFFSVLAARLNPPGRVLAIEPSPAALKRLKDNLARNGVVDRVEVFEGVASDRAGAAVLHLIEDMEEYSSLGPIVHASVADQSSVSIEVRADSIDTLVARHRLDPGLIKIDVEGAEQHVFDGAMATLERHRPVVVSELSPALLEPMGASAQAIIARLRAIGYRVIDAEDPLLEPGLRAYGEILCLPE